MNFIKDLLQKSNVIKNNKKLALMVIAGFMIIALIFISELKFDTDFSGKNEIKKEMSTEEYCAYLEQKVTEIIECIDGAGKTIYLHPLQEKEMYVYDLTTATLTKQEYNIEGIELFNDFGEKEKQLGWDPTVFQTINCVQVGEHRWIHLESGSGLLQDLAVVVTKDGKREAYLKVFGELVGE